MSKSPGISASSSRTASSKTKGFQFLEGGPTETLSLQSQENKITRKPSSSKPSTQERLLDDKDIKTSESQHTKFPSTPATRLPLSDLIGNVDDFNPIQPTAQASPEDQIQWRSARSPLTADGKRTASSQGRRAQSSSPPPSSVRSASQKARLTLQAPDLDPAADLWHRYATSSARDGQGPVQAPNFVSLVNTSSPRAAVGEKAGTIGGLRRWTSCGVEWPSSKAKRRKTRHTVIREQIEEVFADSTPIKNTSQTDEAKRARIGSLINRIQESLVNQLEAPIPQAPSSSSPLPERSPSVERKTLSPILEDQDFIHEANDNLHIRLSQSLRLPSPNMDSRSTTSFGSAEFDDTIFDVAQSNNQTFVNDTNNTSVEDLHTATTIGSHHHDNPGMPQTEEAIAMEDSTLVNEDDFDDDLELSDIDEDDFEKIATNYDNSIMIPHDQVQAPSVSQSIQEQEAFGDEDFGDDVDDDDFAAAEAAATQSYQGISSQNSHVCTVTSTFRSHRY